MLPSNALHAVHLETYIQSRITQTYCECVCNDPAKRICDHCGDT